MKFICPYCRYEFRDEPLSTCPKCGKTMNIPGRFKNAGYRERKKAREIIEREARRKRGEMGLDQPHMDFGRKKNSFLFMMLIVMSGLGALLVTRSRHPVKRSGPATMVLTAQGNVNTLTAAMELYRIDCGRYPDPHDGLDALIRSYGIKGWSGPYVRFIRSDPWRVPFNYTNMTEKIVISSSGPDKTAGTDDDIFPEKSAVTNMVADALAYRKKISEE